nr:ATP-binding protein [Kitasatospora sp. MAA4]
MTDDEQDSVIVVASELLTNSIHYSDRPTVAVVMFTEYRRSGLVLTFEVYDGSTVLPLPRAANATDEGGRGLSIVDRLASRHGSEQTPSGKRVWAQFDLPSAGARYRAGLARRIRAIAPRPTLHRQTHEDHDPLGYAWTARRRDPAVAPPGPFPE